MTPPFFFQINRMRENRYATSRLNNTGLWLPPVGKDSSQLEPDGISNKIFYCKEGSVKEAELPPTAEPYKTYSMYCDSEMFWAVDFDATQHAVEDESSDEGSDKEEEEESAEEGPDKEEKEQRSSYKHSNKEEESEYTEEKYSRLADEEYSGYSEEQYTGYTGGQYSGSAGGQYPGGSEEEYYGHTEGKWKTGWKPLLFTHNAEDYSSYLTLNGEHQVLRTANPSQRWINKLLPRCYRADPQTHTPHPEYGGMNGELPLLLGLVAFAVPEDEVERHIHAVRHSGIWTTSRGHVRGCKHTPQTFSRIVFG